MRARRVGDDGVAAGHDIGCANETAFAYRIWTKETGDSAPEIMSCSASIAAAALVNIKESGATSSSRLGS